MNTMTQKEQDDILTGAICNQLRRKGLTATPKLVDDIGDAIASRDDGTIASTRALELRNSYEDSAYRRLRAIERNVIRKMG